jgi:hypothetical protein
MQLSFEYNFQYPGDEVYCSYTVPYTYSNLTSHINEIKG